MTTESNWPELDAAITATRAARDRSAQAAVKADLLGIPTLGAELASLAASYDRLLANLLYVQRTPGSLHPNWRPPTAAADPGPQSD